MNQENNDNKELQENFRTLNLILGKTGLSGRLDGLGRNMYKTWKKIEDLNENLEKFNKSSSKLQLWLIIWTAVIAIATIINLFL